MRPRDLLLREIGIDPLFPDVQHREMIATGFPKVLVRLVGVHLFIFGAIEERVPFLQH